MLCEKWKPIAGYEGFYEVSDQGRVRSLDRVVNRSRFGKLIPIRRRGGVMKNQQTPTGYEVIILHKNGVSDARSVHRMVLNAFASESKFDGAVCHHIDGDKRNNRASNLKWVTQSENVTETYRSGRRHCVGENHGIAKLTEFKVKIIKTILRDSPGRGAVGLLAKTFNVNQSTISRIKSGSLWAHVEI